MASFYNLDSEEAFNKLRGGLTGEAEGLKALGILVDENTVKQTAYSAGIAATGAELTQEQKVLARYVAILNQTGNAQGDLARTLDSPSNMLRSLGQNVKNLSISFSALLMPAVKFVLPILNALVKVAYDAVNALAPLGDKFADFLGVSDTSAGDEAKAVSASVGDVGDGLDDANEKAKKLKKSLAGFDEMNVLQDNSSDSADTSAAVTGGGLGFDLDEYNAKLELAGGKTAVIAENIKKGLGFVGKYAKIAWDSAPVQAHVGAVISYAKMLFKYWSTLGYDLYNNVKTTWGNISGNVITGCSNMVDLWTTSWTDIQNGIDTWGQPIIDGVSGLFNSIWADAVDPAMQIVSQIWADHTGNLLATWNEYGQPLIDKVGEFATKIIALFQSIWDNVLEPIIAPFLQTLGELWAQYLEPLEEDVMGFVSTAVDAALLLLNKVVLPVLMWLNEWLKPVFVMLGKIIANAFGTAVAVISSAISGIIGFLKGIIDFIVGVFTGDWDKAWNGIKSAFKSVFDSFVKIGKATWNSIKGIFSALGEFFGGIWDGLKNGAKAAWDGVKSVFSAVGGFFKDVFSKAWKGVVAVFSVAGDIFVNIKDGIVSVFKTVVNGIIRGINSVVKLPFEGFNKVLETIHGLSILGVKPFSWLTWRAPVPQIPELARGGIVDQPTYAMIGEAGKEAVMPLERNTGWIDQLADKLADKIGGGNGDIKLTVKLGEDTIFDKFIEYGRSKSFETNGEVVFA